MWKGKFKPILFNIKNKHRRIQSEEKIKELREKKSEYNLRFLMIKSRLEKDSPNLPDNFNKFLSEFFPSSVKS